MRAWSEAFFLQPKRSRFTFAYTRRKARVFATFKQTGKIVKRRVNVAAAYGLDKRRSQLVVVVAVLVVANEHLWQRRLDVLQIAPVFGQGTHIFHKIQQGAGVAVRNPCQQVCHIVGHLQLQVAGPAPGKLNQFCAAQGPQPQYMQA